MGPCAVRSCAVGCDGAGPGEMLLGRCHPLPTPNSLNLNRNSVPKYKAAVRPLRPPLPAVARPTRPLAAEGREVPVAGHSQKWPNTYPRANVPWCLSQHPVPYPRPPLAHSPTTLSHSWQAGQGRGRATPGCEDVNQCSARGCGLFNRFKRSRGAVLSASAVVCSRWAEGQQQSGNKWRIG